MNGALIAVAADFTGKYSPYQSVQIRPNPSGGVFVAATDAGRIAFLGFDPAGKGDEEVVLLPTAELSRTPVLSRALLGGLRLRATQPVAPRFSRPHRRSPRFRSPDRRARQLIWLAP